VFFNTLFSVLYRIVLVLLFFPSDLHQPGQSFRRTGSFATFWRPASAQIPVFFHTYLCFFTHSFFFVFWVAPQICLRRPVFQRDSQLHPSPASSTSGDSRESSVFQHLILSFLTHHLGFPFSSPLRLSPASFSEGLGASPLSSIQHLRNFQCFSTLFIDHVFVNTSSCVSNILLYQSLASCSLCHSDLPQPCHIFTFAGSGGWVSQLVMPWPQFLSLTPPALARHHASLVRSLRVLGSCVTCGGSTSSAMPGELTGCLNSDPQQNMGSLKQSCVLPPAGCAPLASKPIPWEFFRVQPTQTHASACGIWRMAWFPLM
jgi:hypothetical protein